MSKKEISLKFDLCVSEKCDRGCLHCADNSDMNGSIFSIENATMLSREINRLSKLKMFNDYDILTYFCVTGGGEPLLNPELVCVLDILMGSSKNIFCGIVTSGANPASESETVLIQKIAKRSYSDRISFALSFNDFQKDFSERFVHTAELLFRNGIETIFAKVCLQNYYNETLRNFSKMLKKYCVDNFYFDLNDEFLFYSFAEKEETLKIMDSILQFHSKNEKGFLKSVEDYCVNIKNLSEKQMIIDSDYHLINFQQTILLKTSFGERKIVFLPHFLFRAGRAENFNKELIPDVNHSCLCHYLKGESNLYLNADGYYYPCAECPKIKDMIIGHISDDIRKVVYWHNFLKKPFLREILAYSGSVVDCDICARVIRNFWE